MQLSLEESCPEYSGLKKRPGTRPEVMGRVVGTKPGLYMVKPVGYGVSRQKGTRSEGPERVGDQPPLGVGQGGWVFL